jgi:trans-2,3-dihydro-3-hydroxyanthranilate isomerase
MIVGERASRCRDCQRRPASRRTLQRCPPRSVSPLPVIDLAAVARCRPDAVKLGAAIGDHAAYVFCAETVEPGHDFHARMFAPRLGIHEDPATGSAVAAFAGFLAARGLADGAHAYAIEQGYEMKRPSLINLELTMAGGKLASAAVGGDAVVVTQGTIET